MTAPVLEFTRGKTFGPLVIRWETNAIIYKQISAISQTAPVRMTVTGHNIPNGWRAAVSGVKGMVEINVADPSRIRDDEYHQVTVIDANTVEMNEVNAAGFRTYASGGYLQYNTPADLTGQTARLAIKAKAGESNLLKCTVGGVAGTVKPTAAGKDGAVTWVATVSGTPEKEWVAGATYVADDVVDTTDLLRLTTENGRIAIDTSGKTISLTVSAADTALMGWKRGEYDLEMVSSDVVPIVKSLFGEIGKASVGKEVTTNA